MPCFSGTRGCRPAVLALALLAVACDDGGPASGGDAGALPAPPSAVLEVLGGTSLALAPDEGADVRVVVRIDGTPTAGIPVDFAFEGQALDATLSQLRVITDDLGIAAGSMRAGSTASTFRIRIRADVDGAPTVYVDVAVSNAGFGQIAVVAPYPERPDAQRVLELHVEATCEELRRFDLDERTPARTRVLGARGDEVIFATLPPNLSYALFATVRTADGVVVAERCLDGLAVEADESTEVEIVFRPVPQDPSGAYLGTLTLALDAPVERAVDAARRAAAAVLQTDGTGASALLDALADRLEEDGAAAAAAALAADRAAIEGALEGRLTETGSGPAVALDTLLASTAARLDTLRAQGRLAVDLDASGAAEASWDVSEVALGGAPPDGTALAFVTLDTLDVALRPRIGLDWRPSRDQMQLTEVRVDLPFGQALVAASSDGGRVPGVALLAEDSGCGAFGEEIAERAALAPACDGTCAQEVCDEVLGRVWEAVEAGWTGLDDTLAELFVEGSVDVVDEDGDLVSDRWAGAALTGTYGAGEEGDDLTGMFEALRATTP
jgi:hypothetical protein